MQAPITNSTSKELSASLSLEFVSTTILKIHVQTSASLDDADFIAFNMVADKEEEVYGFGLQYTVWNHKGLKVPIISSEGGVGRGLQPLTALLNEFNNN